MKVSEKGHLRVDAQDVVRLLQCGGLRLWEQYGHAYLDTGGPLPVKVHPSTLHRLLGRGWVTVASRERFGVVRYELAPLQLPGGLAMTRLTRTVEARLEQLAREQERDAANNPPLVVEGVLSGQLDAHTVIQPEALIAGLETWQRLGGVVDFGGLWERTRNPEELCGRLVNYRIEESPEGTRYPVVRVEITRPEVRRYMRDRGVAGFTLAPQGGALKRQETPDGVEVTECLIVGVSVELKAAPADGAVEEVQA